MKSDAPKPPLRLALLMWGLGALFYLMGFFQRVAPAVMTTELMRAFDISAAALGNLSAFYFYSYVAMQIPTGVLADRWGPRRLLTLGALVAGIGTALFSLAPGIILANMGRLLIGGSVAVAFVGVLKLSNSWFAPRYFAMASGIALFFGIIGAVSAGTPLRLLVNRFSWRSVILSSALATFAIAAAIWIFVRDYPHQKGYQDLTSAENASAPSTDMKIMAGIAHVFRYANTWLLFIVPGGIVGCVLTFSGLWGIPYLTTHYHLPASRSAALTSALLVAWAAAGPIFGWLSDRIGYRKPLYIAGCAVSLAGWTVTLFCNSLSISVLVAVLLVTGFASGCMIIGFAFAKESVPAHLAGTVSGVINMGVMMGPMLLQPVVGWILDRRWEGQTLEGIRIYGLQAYRAGFVLMIAWLALSFILIFFTRETHCRQSV